MRKLIVAALLALITLTGCATLNNITATQDVIANQVLTLGAEIYIEKAGGTATPPATYSAAQQARAQSVYNIAVEISGFATGSVTLTQLDSAMAKWAQSLKSPLEQTAAQALIAEINIVLGTKVSTGVLNAAVTAAVTEITADWENAALAYGATPAPAGLQKRAARW
jgi:hypothetical protein